MLLTQKRQPRKTKMTPVPGLMASPPKAQHATVTRHDRRRNRRIKQSSLHACKPLYEMRLIGWWSGGLAVDRQTDRQTASASLNFSNGKVLPLPNRADLAQRESKQVASPTSNKTTVPANPMGSYLHKHHRQAGEFDTTEGGSRTYPRYRRVRVQRWEICSGLAVMEQH